METLNGLETDMDASEWAESEWFQVWLQLARGEENERTPKEGTTEGTAA